MLPPQADEHKGKKCLVLDLDETLLHSSFKVFHFDTNYSKKKPVDSCDFTIQVEIENVLHTVYVLKRPHVAEFLQEMAKEYELVVFTASLSKVFWIPEFDSFYSMQIPFWIYWIPIDM